MGYAIFVFGPAGSGKSTFCRNIQEHGESVGRTYKVINLDPAQIAPGEGYALDLRDFITVGDVMEEYDYGPNGGLLLALEELYENIDELRLEDFEGAFLVFDCPGQIELFAHSEIMPKIIDHVGRHFKCGVVYMMESQYLVDINKYVSGCFCALVSMSRLNIPCINVISKMDLVKSEDLEMFYTPTEELSALIGRGKYSRICKRMLSFVAENSMLNFHPLDWNKEESVEELFYSIDNAVQYYEDAEPKTKDFD
ncbi:putative ATP binding protein [Encephalitozoon intestinalis ATCC 50506]|uniref:GPN-loop GTPase 3 n=1 Tax=Encephalitozoon intestinalis (strain ATCC 50506) TaxID=876142 RepID=E0S7X7_ENCIT|nr:putative ATP binding protein [Encephalitozoon intestinalis ATCC 50506]ADM11812.1 putative ATP binding protein [Encephalitozoon intestinalis ATCC 50506]UTX45562.1 GPN-loop GTPase 3 [Encephalitozoon intestinalis]